MAHDHHHHDDTFYRDQLASIALCGLLGAVCVLLWVQGIVAGFLAPNFQLPVLLCGLALLGLVGVRAVLIWQSAGQPAACGDACGHDHAHDHNHDEHHHTHDHNHHDHAHGHDHHHHDRDHEHGQDHHHHDHAHGEDHGHDHGWSPWRYAVLLLPIVLFFLGLPPAPILTVRTIAAGSPPPARKDGSPQPGVIPPVTGTVQTVNVPESLITLAEGDQPYYLDRNVEVYVDGRKATLADITPGTPVTLTLGRLLSGLSAEYILRQLQNRMLEDLNINAVESRGQGIENLTFPVMERAAMYPELRESLAGKTGRLRGQFMPGANDRVASLVRIKMTCCLADVRPLEVVVIAPERLGDYQPYDWVEVTGQIQFRKRQNRDVYVPVLQLQSPEQMQRTEPDPEAFLY